MDSSQIVGRGPQVGLVVASATVPGTFTRSLSERTWVDQGIITGLSTVTQYVVSVVAQDGIDIGGSLLARILPFPDAWSDEQRRRAATLLLDITVVPIGFGLAGLFRFRDNDDQMRALVRQVGLRLGVTGTGYVNYVATACVQYLTRGDVASVTLQYSKRPSPLSLGKVKAAAEQNRLLWLRIFERVRAMSPADRPKVVLFGESLGALTSQNVLIGWGTLGLQALGIDRALWVGTPETSAWMHEVTGEPRPDVDKSLVAMVNDYEQFCDLGDDGKERVRYVLLSHDNDGVTKFGPRLINRRPAWLGPQRPVQQAIPGRSPRGIPPSMQWRLVTTFYQSLIDMKNAQIPGAYRAWAHDYRPDLADFIRDVFDLDCTAEQLDRIKLACRQREEFREAVFR